MKTPRFLLAISLTVGFSLPLSAQFTVQADGGALILDGVTLNSASIKVYKGGSLIVKNGSVLNREDGDILEVDLGGVMEWTEGTMVQQ